MPNLRHHREPVTVAALALMLATLYSCSSGSAEAKADDGNATNPANSAPANANGGRQAGGRAAGGGNGGGPGIPRLPWKGREANGQGPAPTPGQPVAGAPGTGQPSNGAKKYTFERPKTVKGIYLTAWSAGSPTKMAKMLAMIDRTELNAVVIDVRDTGDMYWKTGIKLADESGATQVAVPKPDQLFESLEKHKVWPIARIACFRDVWVPKKHPELAVQLTSGGVWRDRSGHAWLDPYNKKNWEYIAQTVDFALDAGFPEIQLDYVRFPSEGKSATQKFPGRKDYDDPKAKPEDVIASFAKFIGDRVRARGAQYSADIFGIISSNKGSEGIGQQLEKVAEPFDVISPMVYPSHFANGEYGVANPNRQPYAIITKSLADYKKRLPKKAVRPWLQDFSLGYHYGPAEVKAQLKAMRELGYEEFLLWNAGNRYTEAALAKEGATAKAANAAKPGATKPGENAKPADSSTSAQPKA
jgi:hypothetical protein